MMNLWRELGMVDKAAAKAIKARILLRASPLEWNKIIFMILSTMKLFSYG